MDAEDLSSPSLDSAALKWSALHHAAGVVAMLGGSAPEPRESAPRNFPATLLAAGGWRRALAERGIDDLAAIMEPGIAALLAVEARGASCTAAAAALWDEFLRARDALLALAAPDGAAARWQA